MLPADLLGADVWGLSLAAWLTAAVVALMVGGLVHGKVGADLVLLAGLLVLLLAGILTPSDALLGFANPGVATVGLLYVVAAGLRETGAVDRLTGPLLGRPRSSTSALARLTPPVAFASAFVNNTPIVAMFLPVLSGWARRCNLSPRALFLPLSYAAMLGGMCTLIGTSTNLVVAALIDAHREGAAAGDAPALAPLGMFTLARVGLPVALAGLGFMLLAHRRLLSRADEGALPLRTDPKEYMTALRVEPDSPVAGRTVEQAGLRHLPGLYLSRIERSGETIVAVSPEQRIQAGDTLVFVGAVESVVDLQRIKGLTPAADEVNQRLEGPRHQIRLVEAVLAAGSDLVGLSIRDAAFRTRYGAVVIAVHRGGERLRGKLGDIRLKPGDTLLLEAPAGFALQHRDSRDFYLVTEQPGAASPRHSLAPVALAILGGLVVAITLQPQLALVFALAAALGMILTRCCTGPEARSAVDWQVLIVIGASFGLGLAMERTGLAAALAHSVAAAVAPLGGWAPLAAIFALTAAFTQVISNNAAAVLMFPIALEVSRTAGAPFLPYAATLALAASAGFASPIGYQTNLMVMGPGGYKPADFVRFGLPLTILTGVVCVALAPLVYG